jgi:rod shape-determining protein MreC
MWPWKRRSPYGADSLKRTGNKPKPAVFLGVALALSFGVGAAHNRWQAGGKSDPLVAGAQTVVAPVQIAGTRTRNAAQTLWDGFTSGPRLALENERLKAELERVKGENNTLREKAAEADRLRSALGFVRGGKQPPLAAGVIGLLPAPHFETVTLDRGAKDGVRSRAIVRTPAGMVGQVIETGPISSNVLLLTDVKSRVHVVVVRDGKPLGSYGVVRGGGRGLPLRVTDLGKDDDIKPGDLVVSSGFGGVIPPDIPVGVVETVREDATNYLKSARIKPLAPQPGDLREAYILP